MTESGFDVVVVAFGTGSSESPVAALCRIIGVTSETAERLSRQWPSVVSAGVSYTSAESQAASLQLAGAEVRLVPHGQAITHSEPVRMTLLEIGSGLVQGRDEALLALRFDGAHQPAPITLRPSVANDVSPRVQQPEIEAGAAQRVRGERMEAGLCATALDLGVREAALGVAPAALAAAPLAAVPAAPAPLNPGPAPRAAAPSKAVGPRWLSFRDATESPSLERIGTPSPATPPTAAAIVPSPSSNHADASFADDFGRDLDQDLQPRMPPQPRALGPSIPAPWAIDEGRVSLGFPEPFAPLKSVDRKQRTAKSLSPIPLRPVPAPLVSNEAGLLRAKVAGADGAGSLGGSRTTRASRLPPWAKTTVPKDANGRIDIFADARDGLPRRTVWLLGALWLSVALLLWANGLLF